MSYGKQLRSNSKDVAHLFNSYFSDQFSHPSNYSVEIDFSNDPYFDKVFDEKAIFDLLIKINVNKAAGPDGHVQMNLKHLFHFQNTQIYPFFVFWP